MPSAKSKSSGPFITRAMRKVAEGNAQTEANAKQQEADDAADKQEQAAYYLSHPEIDEGLRGEHEQKAIEKATANARLKYKLDKPFKASRRSA